MPDDPFHSTVLNTLAPLASTLFASSPFVATSPKQLQLLIQLSKILAQPFTRLAIRSENETLVIRTESQEGRLDKRRIQFWQKRFEEFIDIQVLSGELLDNPIEDFFKELGIEIPIGVVLFQMKDIDFPIPLELHPKNFFVQENPELSNKKPKIFRSYTYSEGDNFQQTRSKILELYKERRFSLGTDTFLFIGERSFANPRSQHQAILDKLSRYDFAVIDSCRSADMSLQSPCPNITAICDTPRKSNALYDISRFLYSSRNQDLIASFFIARIFSQDRKFPFRLTVACEP